MIADHARYEVELGVLEDRIFEGLHVGVDLSGVWPAFAVWMLSDTRYGTRRYLTTDAQRAATDAVIALYRERVPADDPRWRVARRAAAAAADAASCASDAAYYAAKAASCAAYSADAAVYSAADANATADSDSVAARHGWYAAAAKRLLTLLRAAPVRP